MILSNEGIRRALDEGKVVFEPRPRPDQYTTSAVDLFLGDDFRVWDRTRFEAPGVKVEVNLAQQEFQRTANAYLVPATREPDGSVVLAPHSRTPSLLLAVTREQVQLKHEAKLAARVYLRLVPGTTRVCQLIFEQLEDSPEGEIATGFQGQDLASGGRSKN